MGIHDDYNRLYPKMLSDLGSVFDRMALFPQQRTLPVNKPIPKIIDDINAKTDTLEEACIVAESFKKMLPGYSVTVREVLEGCDYTITAVKYEDK